MRQVPRSCPCNSDPAASGSMRSRKKAASSVSWAAGESERNSSAARRDNRSLGKPGFAADLVVVSELRIGVLRGRSKIVEGLVVGEHLQRRDAGILVRDPVNELVDHAVGNSVRDAILDVLGRALSARKESIEIATQARPYLVHIGPMSHPICHVFT